MTATTLPAVSTGAFASERSATIFPGIVGFFFIFRACLTYLFFQGDPVAGTIVNLAINLALLFGAVLYSFGARESLRTALPLPPPMRWMLALFALSAVSLCWTGAQSLAAALGYWVDMAADVVIVVVVLRCRDATDCTESIMQGAVWGAFGLAVVAWCSPVTEELRLGNDAFLHPNTLGLELGIATLIAQYLATRGGLWKWLSLLLGVTLLRTLSKTAILAFLFAEYWYLMQSRGLTRRAKVQLGAFAVGVVAIFWRFIDAYLTVYNAAGSGNQAETLTGRTVLWATAFSMGMEKPWFGHGFYSFKALIPALGPFAAVHAHNELLQQFFEFGLAGVLIVVALYSSFWRHVRRAPSSELRTLTLALLIFSLLRGLADTLQAGLSYPLWLMAALSVCLANPWQSEARS